MKQPEALRIADALDTFHNPNDQQAAAELRRLHKENERLKTVPMKYRRMEFNAQLQEENKRLHALNQELLEALKQIEAIEELLYGGDWEEIEQAKEIASAAIAKGEKE